MTPAALSEASAALSFFFVSFSSVTTASNSALVGVVPAGGGPSAPGAFSYAVASAADTAATDAPFFTPPSAAVVAAGSV